MIEATALSAQVAAPLAAVVPGLAPQVQNAAPGDGAAPLDFSALLEMVGGAATGATAQPLAATSTAQVPTLPTLWAATLALPTGKPGKPHGKGLPLPGEADAEPLSGAEPKDDSAVETKAQLRPNSTDPGLPATTPEQPASSSPPPSSGTIPAGAMLMAQLPSSPAPFVPRSADGPSASAQQPAGTVLAIVGAPAVTVTQAVPIAGSAQQKAERTTTGSQSAAKGPQQEAAAPAPAPAAAAKAPTAKDHPASPGATPPSAERKAEAALPVEPALPPQPRVEVPGPFHVPVVETAQTAPSEPSVLAVGQAQDISALIDRIAEARAAASPHGVRAAMVHQDFGPISLRFRAEESHIQVTFGSADPGFAPAVQAAASASLSGGMAGDSDRREPSAPPSPAQSFAAVDTRAGGQQQSTQQRAPSGERPQATSPAATLPEADDVPQRRDGLYV